MKSNISNRSSMWKVMSKDFQQVKAYDESGARNSNRGYGFVAAKSNRTIHLFFNTIFCSSIWFLMKICKVISSKLFSRVMNRAGPHDVLFGIGQKELSKVLPKHEYCLFDRDCNSLGISPKEFNTVKCWYFANLISKQIKAKHKLFILEVGGGSGSLATFLNYSLECEQYWLVDLPEMLQFSKKTLETFFPDQKIFLATRADHFSKDSLSKSKFVLVPNTLAEFVPNTFFDVCVNIDSFQEMNLAQVKSYLSIWDRSSKTGGVQVNCNRRKFLTIEGEDNNPLQYPYPAENQTIANHVDPFMQRTLNAVGNRQDPWILRVDKKS